MHNTLNPWKKTHILSLLCLFSISIFIFWPLFQNICFDTFDWESGVERHLAMMQFFGKGQLLPVWMPDYHYGYGGPLFNFYAPLFSMISAPIDLLGAEPLRAINITCFLGFLGSGLAMYAYVYYLISKRSGALLAAIAYMCTPYHMADVFWRGAYGESLTFIFLPLIFLGITLIMKERSVAAILLTSVSTGMLFLTHNIIGFISFPMIVIFILYNFSFDRSRKPLLRATTAVLIGIGLSAFFIIPMIAEKKFLNLDNFIVTVQYKNFFPRPIQLLFSLKESLALSFKVNPFAQGAPTEIGWVLVGTSLTGLVSAILFASKRLKREFFFFIIALGLSLFMVLDLSRPLWDKLHFMSVIQASCRFLTISSVFIALLIGGIGLIPHKRLRFILVIFFSLLIIWSTKSILDPKLPHSGKIPWIESPHALKIVDQILMKKDLEFTPGVVKINIPAPAPRLLDFSIGTGAVLSYKKVSPIEHKYNILAKTPVICCFFTTYFPGWHVFVDGKKATLIDNKYGFMMFPLSPGEHAVHIFFGPTPVRIAGGLLSLGSLIWLLLWAWRIRRKT